MTPEQREWAEKTITDIEDSRIAIGELLRRMQGEYGTAANLIAQLLIVAHEAVGVIDRDHIEAVAKAN